MKLTPMLVKRLVELLFRLLKLKENPDDSDFFFVAWPSISFTERADGEVGRVGECGHDPVVSSLVIESEEPDEGRWFPSVIVGDVVGDVDDGLCEVELLRGRNVEDMLPRIPRVDS